MATGAQIDTTLRNTINDALTARIGNAGLLRPYTGTKPASCAASLSGNTLLAEVTLGSPFSSASSAGSMSPTLPASNPNALASGTCTFYRIYKADGTTCVFQDDVVPTSNGLVLNPSSNVITSGQPFIIQSMTFVAPGA